MRDIVKTFPGTRALDGVSLTVEAGEIHALVGENGAGKSTLMKVLSGVHPTGTFDGEVLVDGTIRHFRRIRESEKAGIAIIFQELSLIEELTVAENIFLGREPARFGIVDRPRLYHQAGRLLAELHLDLDPRVPVGRLGIGTRQLVEIAKALSREARILVLDEPTAALSEGEAETLFSILRKLRSRGVGMVYISHKLEEVFALADRITVLRDGRAVATGAKAELTEGRVIELMVGREVTDIFPRARRQPGETVLEVERLTAYSVDARKRPVVENVSLSVRRGEVLGIAGLMGSGRTELLTTLFGAWPGRTAGVKISGREVRLRSPRAAIRNGLALVTEDRQRLGLVVGQSIRENVALASLARIAKLGLTNPARETKIAAGQMQALGIRAASPAAAASSLSGGNQQKVVLGKWLAAAPKVLLLDEPTRGIDIGAKQEIYREIDRLAEQGMAIILVSSELNEVLGLADRILVLANGRVTREFGSGEATPELVMAAATRQPGLSMN
jgi:D-xylose transport system ATP-binding protein